MLGFEEFWVGFCVFEHPLGGSSWQGCEGNVGNGNVDSVVLLEFWSVVRCGFFVFQERV